MTTITKDIKVVCGTRVMQVRANQIDSKSCIVWRQICVESVAAIVIALKRNGAYAEDIQVQQLGFTQVV